MPRLLFHVEGQTEETFVKEVLGPHLYAHGFHSISARFIGSPRKRGGICGWSEARKEIVGNLREDSGLYVTTMVDYYGLPQSEGRQWPGRREAAAHSVRERANVLEEQIRRDVLNELDTTRFIPYVSMHEFEALLFSDCESLCREISRPDLLAAFRMITEQFGNPEEINDLPESAPSRRILALLPTYSKPLFGTLAALEIGLGKMRAECPHFDGWVRRLEELK